jgi:twinkle protein
MPSKFLKHEPCPQCNSKDNAARFDDGHLHCFGCGYQEQPTTQEKAHPPRMPVAVKPPPVTPLIEFTTIKELSKRGITADTCKHFNYGTSTHQGQPVQVAEYRNQKGDVVAQHVRFPDKKFRWLGSTTDMQLWGQHLWRQGHGSGSNLFVVVTEGEIDAMSVSQVQGNKFPVVSLPNGAQSAKKYLAANAAWLGQFSRIVLCFDNDEPGRQAAEEALTVLPLGKVAICHLPRKDANEMLQAGEGQQLRDLLWKATPSRPDGIVNASELWDELIRPGATAVANYPWPQLDRMTHGFRKGEMTTLAAGSGIGKSSICRHIAHHFLCHGLRIGYIALEESIQRTMQGIVGLELGKPIHLDPTLATQDEVRTGFDRVFGTGRCYLYDHFGSMDPDHLLNKIRYLADGEGADLVILDHLTIVISGLADLDERRAIDVTCTKLRQVVEQTGVGLILVSHLKRPEGRGHEEGAQTSLSQLRGSHAIAQLSDMVIGAERNQQGDPAERNELQLRVLKNRFSGQTGLVDKLLYDQETGRLVVPISTYFGT